MRRALGLLPLALLAVSALPGCELFGLDDSEIEINVPEQTIGPFELPLSALEIPAGAEGQVVRWVGPPGADVDLTSAESGQPKLEKYRDRIKRIEIRRITYRISENTLDGDLPPLEVYFSPAGAVGLGQDPDTKDSAIRYGESTPITPGLVHSSAVAFEVEPGAKEATGDVMSTLSFATLFGTHLSLAAGSRVPSGKIKIEVGIQLTVFAEAF